MIDDRELTRVVRGVVTWAGRCAVLIGVALLSCFASAAEDRELASAIRGGLAWLVDNQVAEGEMAGSWPTPKPEYRPAVASLAGLAFLANGHTPFEGEHAAAVHRALRHVMGTMTPDGYLGQGDRSGMYIHAIGMLFGLSCLGMTGDAELEPQLAQWCRKGLDVIIQGQQVRRSALARGGWRYTPYTSESDVSVTSWQLAVLHSARQCGYDIDPGVVDDALAYVDRAFMEVAAERAGFLYRPGVSQQPDPAVTGAAVFVRSMWGTEDPDRLRAALNYLTETKPSWGGPQYGRYFFFSSFYLTQGMFQIGRQTWDDYSDALRGVLLAHQQGSGNWPYPVDNAPQSRLAGPAYPTAMAVLMLSLDTQYLPMYQRQKRLF